MGPPIYGVSSPHPGVTLRPDILIVLRAFELEGWFRFVFYVWVFFKKKEKITGVTFFSNCLK